MPPQVTQRNAAGGGCDKVHSKSASSLYTVKDLPRRLRRMFSLKCMNCTSPEWVEFLVFCSEPSPLLTVRPCSAEATSLDWKISVFGKSYCVPLRLPDEKSSVISSLKRWKNRVGHI
jgi:hypothetical protein